MPAFRTSGSTGPAPTTVWFGKIPDKLNMLLPAHSDVASATNFYYDKLFAANFLNQWTIWNETFAGGSNISVGSFGGFTTAPDGTTNVAQAFVEAATNTQHFVNAGTFTKQGEIGRLRLAGFFKNFGRRVILGLQTANGGFSGGFVTGSQGCKAIFDLAGGQIGVANTVFGGAATTNWTVFPARMVSYGGGWYLCSVEATINNITPNFIAGGNQILCYITLDNGTGTNAESSTYLGDGISGVYGWRTNLMPPRAYGLNNNTLFDDFNDPTMAEIDLNNTKAAGFKFYMANGWPLLPGDHPAPIGAFSVNSSVLEIAAWNSGGTSSITLQTATPLSSVQGTAYIGTTFVAPFLHEVNCTWPYATDQSFTFQTVTAWCWGVDFLARQPKFGDPANGPQVIGLMGREIDFFESSGGGARGNDALYPVATDLIYGLSPTGQTAPAIAAGLASVGYPVWSAVKQYTPPNDHVFFSGAYYTCTNTAFGAGQSPSNASFWTAYVGPPTPITLNLTNVFHTYSTLVLPYVAGDFGMTISFFDGAYAFSSPYGPTSTFDSQSQATDFCKLSFNLGTGDTSVSPPLNFFIDSISVMQ